MRAAILGCLLVVGCAGGQRAIHPVVASNTVTTTTDTKPITKDGKDDPVVVQPDLPHAAKNATWIGASAESEALLVGTNDTAVGVWVDAPIERPKARVPVDLALVVDTSGSMAGAKMESAKRAAKTIIDSLADGDIVSIAAFDNDARTIAEPTVLSSTSRPSVLSKIEMLRPSGSTNMFDGLSLAEMHASRAPQTHGVRRVVVISDGIANVGPSSPDALGALAEKGLRFRTQVTSLGVGTEYDERTLNALALRTTGRLYHLSEPKEMASMLKREVDLLTSTVASDAFVEIVAANGVTFTATEGARGEWISRGTSLKIPLGTLFAGQHREMLVRARVTPGVTNTSAPLASVRLHFKDPDEGDLERVQEVVARFRFTNDEKEVFTAQSARTRSIVAIMDAAKVEIQAAQSVSSGQVLAADADLARAQASLEKKATEISDETQRARVQAQARSIGATRAAMPKPTAPAPMMRDSALKMNQAGMAAEGF